MSRASAALARHSRRASRWWWLAALALSFAACSSADDESEEKDRKPGAEDSPEVETERAPPGGPPLRPFGTSKKEPAFTDDSDDARKLVYLVTIDDKLFSFSPRKAGRSAYRLVGTLDCKSHGRPQSMAIDREGWAWVFFDSRQLFKVNISNAKCEGPTPYKHPTGGFQLGMGFTAESPGSEQERLFVLSPNFGLATIAMPSLEVTPTKKLVGSAELTGGGDGKLFHFAAANHTLSEVDRSTYDLRPLHKFTGMESVQAWAFARYAGRFYVFTSNGFASSRTTVFDPKTNTETVRDSNIGMIVVGAGQSTLAPPSDTGPDISGDFPDDVPVAPPASSR